MKLLIALCLAFSLSAYEIIPDKNSLEVKSTSLQNRTLLKIKLENGLKAYLISDPEAEKSAAALSVNAGSWLEPEEHPGLAHFLEHMLFLGTKSHPEEDSFFRFIKQHGGQSNAFTEDLYTTYVFDIANKEFPEALSLFGEFFYEPLLTPGGSERELEAITQEFQGQSVQDNTRRLMVYKSLGNPAHPWTKFTFGSKESLKNARQKDLKSFMEEHYSADKMVLAVYSALPMEQLTLLVDETFSRIPERKTVQKEFSPPFLSDKTLNNLLLIEPLAEKRSLVFLWPLPEKFGTAFESKPEELVCSILGHEEGGSLLDHLKKEGLAYELGCGSYRWDERHMAFMLEAELTPKGVQNVREVARLVFAYLDEIRKKPLPGYLFDDLQKIQTLKATYPKRQSVFKEVTEHLKGLRYEELETYPAKTLVTQKRDPELARELLGLLTPQTVRIDLMAPASETGATFDRKEPWMGVNYTLTPLPKDFLGGLPKLSTAKLPTKNAFLPENLALLASTEESPRLLETTPYGNLYWADGGRYGEPKAHITLRIRSPKLSYTSAENVADAELWVKLVKSALTERLYSAKQAGLDYSIKFDNSGLYLTVAGFSDKAEKLLLEIVSRLKNFTPDKAALDAQKKRLRSEYLSDSKKPPYEQGIALLKGLLYKSFPSSSEKLAASLNEVHPLTEVSLDALVAGNISSKNAKALYGRAAHILGAPLPEEKRWTREVATFPEKPTLIEEPIPVQGSSLTLALQVAPYTLEKHAALETLSQMLEAPFFKTLRTDQQTGYIVANLSENVDRHLFLLFLVQTFTHDPTDLVSRVELFLEGTLRTLADEKTSFEKTKRALLEKWRTPPENFETYAKELESLALSSTENLHLKKKKADALEALSFERFLTLAKEAIGAQNGRRLALIVRGGGDPNLRYESAGSADYKSHIKY